MRLKKTKSIHYQLSQYGFPIKKGFSNKSWQSSMPSFANVDKNTYLGVQGSVCDLPSLETNKSIQSPHSPNYSYTFDENHKVFASIGLIESDDKQFLMAHGKFNATIKLSTSIFYVNGQFNKHFITHINCTNDVNFNKTIQYLRNKPGSYAVHRFLQDVFIKNIKIKNAKTNEKDSIEKINWFGKTSLIKIGLIILIMYQFMLFLNQHNTIKQH